MNFLITDTFITSLARLIAAEQEAARTTARDLQINAANPRMSFHELDRARDAQRLVGRGARSADAGGRHGSHSAGRRGRI